MRYELVNPSDYIEFAAPSQELAAAACVALSSGWYGAQRLDGGEGEENVPVIAVAGRWWLERFGGADAFCDRWLNQPAGCLAVAEVLDSMCLPRTDRSSCNDITSKARKAAAALRKRAAGGSVVIETAPPPIVVVRT